MRKVDLYKYERAKESGRLLGYFNRVLDEGRVTFHQFGCGYEEFETGPANYTTAVVERSNGRIENVPVDLVTFVKSTTADEGEGTC